VQKGRKVRGRSEGGGYGGLVKGRGVNENIAGTPTGGKNTPDVAKAKGLGNLHRVKWPQHDGSYSLSLI